MELRDFKVGDTVRVHPASDWFMRGVTVATVTKVGRKFLTVTAFGRTFTLAPRNVLEMLPGTPLWEKS